MFRTVWVTIACLFLAAAVLGETKTLKLKDGRTLVGEVTKTADGYQVRMKLGVLVIPADQVVSMTDTVTREEEYQRRAAAIDKNDPQQHYALGEWAFNNGLLEQAQAELKAALALKSDFEKASLLLRQVQAKIERETAPKTRPAKPTTQTGTVGIEPGALAKMMLSEEDIYHVRLEELQLSPTEDPPRGRTYPDNSVAIEFRNEVLKRFIEAMHGQGRFKEVYFDERFLSWAPSRRVSYILENIDRSDTAIKDDILIKTDPKFMQDFRRVVWPMVSQFCALSQCHGGDKPAGGWKVFNIPGRTEDVDYTNFVIINGVRSKEGARMINRAENDLSLLLQFGLPSEQGRYNHPKPIKTLPFTSQRAPNYRRVLDWIGSLKGPRAPDYRLKWVPPFNMDIDTSGRPNLPTAPETPATKPSKEGKEGGGESPIPER